MPQLTPSQSIQVIPPHGPNERPSTLEDATTQLGVTFLLTTTIPDPSVWAVPDYHFLKDSGV